MLFLVSLLLEVPDNISGWFTKKFDLFLSGIYPEFLVDAILSNLESGLYCLIKWWSANAKENYLYTGIEFPFISLITVTGVVPYIGDNISANESKLPKFYFKLFN